MVQSNIILNKDCREGIKEVKDESVDLLLTDPPYNISMPSKFHTMGRQGVDFGEWDKGFIHPFQWLPQACSKVRKGGSAIIFNDYKEIGVLRTLLEKNQFTIKEMLIWCLSGKTQVYTLSQKGISIMTLKDLYRLDPSTVKLWNGEKWTQLLGMSKSVSDSTVKITLRSGEKIIGTEEHQFPTNKGLKRVNELALGDVIDNAILPEPDNPLDCAGVPVETAWFIGLYLAEGSLSVSKDKTVIQISGHSKEVERLEKIKRVAEFYGGSATVSYNGNSQNIRVYGKILPSILKEFIYGKTASDKHLSPKCWRFSNRWLRSLLDGYLSGDGGWDGKNNRWRLGFTNNPYLVSDLRTLASRLNFRLVLNKVTHKGFGKLFKGYSGEIRFIESNHFNRKSPFEVVKLERSKSTVVYELGVEDEPHLFALASGVLTHNCKPNPMPRNRDRLYVTSIEIALWAVKGKGWTFNRQRSNYENAIFNHGTVNARIRKHPTQKPQKLLEEILRIHSNPNDLILDPFSGSGAISVACKRLGRNSLAFEIDKGYYEESILRLNDGV